METTKKLKTSNFDDRYLQRTIETYDDLSEIPLINRNFWLDSCRPKLDQYYEGPSENCKFYGEEDPGSGCCRVSMEFLDNLYALGLHVDLQNVLPIYKRILAWVKSRGPTRTEGGRLIKEPIHKESRIFRELIAGGVQVNKPENVTLNTDNFFNDSLLKIVSHTRHNNLTVNEQLPSGTVQRFSDNMWQISNSNIDNDFISNLKKHGTIHPVEFRVDHVEFYYPTAENYPYEFPFYIRECEENSEVCISEIPNIIRDKRFGLQKENYMGLLQSGRIEFKHDKTCLRQPQTLSDVIKQILLALEESTHIKTFELVFGTGQDDNVRQGFTQVPSVNMYNFKSIFTPIVREWLQISPNGRLRWLLGDTMLEKTITLPNNLRYHYRIQNVAFTHMISVRKSETIP